MLVSDVDFLPSRGLRAAVKEETRWLRNERLALVVPAFQRRGGKCSTIDACRKKLEPVAETVPGRFGQLSRCLREGDCIVFQGDNSLTSHSTTDSKRWMGELEVRPIDCFRSNRYEPYVVVRADRRVVPPYDERFVGYGKNKIQHVSHLRRMGFLFAVLPRQFLVHVPHPRSRDKSTWLNSFRTHQAVDRLYDSFLRELDESYGGATRVNLCTYARRMRRPQDADSDAA